VTAVSRWSMVGGLLALAAALSAAVVPLVMLLRDLRVETRHRDQLTLEATDWLKDTHKRTNPMLTHLDAAAGELAHASKQLAIASQRQQEATAKYMRVLDDSDAVLVSTKAAVDQINGSVASVTAHVNTALEQANGAVGDSRVVLATFNRAVGDLDSLVTDPAWHATLLNIQTTSEHGAGAMTHVDTMAELSEARLRQLFKPGNFIKDLVLRGIGAASQSRTLFTGH
jgi:ABC-type transporter Mla subunit MlaD